MQFIQNSRNSREIILKVRRTKLSKKIKKNIINVFLLIVRKQKKKIK